MTFEELDKIADYDDIYASKQMSMVRMEHPDILSTEDIKVHRVYIGLNTDTYAYGTMTGIIEYKDNFYRFHFHIHKPCQGSPHLSNKMSELEGIKITEKYGIQFVKTTELTWGYQAFWDHTPLDYLKTYDNGSYELRLLMNNIIAYSRKEQYCQKLRKTDKKHLKWLAKVDAEMAAYRSKKEKA